MNARHVIVVTVALVLALQVLRQGAVDAVVDTDPRSAASVWPGHPSVQINRGMTDIAELTRQGQAVTDAAVEAVYVAARKAPLAPEPYLVRGVQAQLAGDAATAERAFAAARVRDPASLPARYFLADQHLRRGDATAGLKEITVLARLAPGGIQSLAPFVAIYARQRQAWPQLRALFRDEPLLEEASLRALATDAANAETVMSLATRRGPDRPWLPAMVDSLIKARDYRRAERLWASISGVRQDSREPLYDADFTDASAPPPFNWSLTSSAVGLAERLRGGGLHVIYHGREDGVLAAQVVLLPAGRHRLHAPLRASGDRAQGLRWSLWCLDTGKEIASHSATGAANSGWTFDVPSGCRAQRLQLVGAASDMPQAADVTISSLRLTREGGGD